MKTLLFAIIALFFISCSNNKLSNEEAAKAIGAIYPQYCSSSDYLNSIYYSAGRPPRGMSANQRREADNKKNIFEKLQKQGLVDITTSKSGFTSNPDITYRIKPSQEAITNYNIQNNRLPLTQSDLLEIVGISQTENEAVVRYKINTTNTPFMELRKFYRKQSRCKVGQEEKEITLIKFDTGWQVKK